MQIVRCKDCKNCYPEEWKIVDRMPRIVRNDVCYMWDKNGVHVQKEWYCSKAERRKR